VPILDCRRVLFYSPGDELSFFEALRRIKAIRRIEGAGDSILLHTSSRISDTALRDLIALFRRYRISSRQLAQFLTESNRHWFHDPQAFWHRRVFASSNTTR
jgi:hypothetical protein